MTATAAPLADVLDRLARQIGMEIVYDGTPPRQRVTPPSDRAGAYSGGKQSPWPR